MFVRDFVNFVLNTSPNLTNIYVKGYLWCSGIENKM